MLGLIAPERRTCMEHVIHELMRDAYSEGGEHERTFLLGGMDAPPLLVDLVHGQLGAQRWLKAPHRESEWLPIHRQMELAHSGCDTDSHDRNIHEGCRGVGDCGAVQTPALAAAGEKRGAVALAAAAAAARKGDVPTAAAFLRGTEEEAPLESRLAFLRDAKQLDSEQIAAAVALVEGSAAVTLE